MADTIDNSADIIDVRDIIARVEELESERETLQDTADDTGETDDDRIAALNALEAFDKGEDGAEARELEAFLADMKGYGGDEQWRGDWYPVTLIRDSYFREYAQDLAEDIGAINADATWPNNCIDWDRATRELRMDYTSVEYGGVTYWYR
jgi:hypothetical protein